MHSEKLTEICGQYVVLRPIADVHAEFLFKLRQDPELTRFVHEGAATLAEQRAWMQRYYSRDDDHTFVVCARKTDVPAGTIGIYNIKRDDRLAELGRWLVTGNSFMSLESDLLAGHYAFTILKLDRLVFSVPAANEKVVSYHRKTGARQTGIAPGEFRKNGVLIDLLLFETDRDTFFEIKQPMLARRLYKGQT